MKRRRFVQLGCLTGLVPLIPVYANENKPAAKVSPQEALAKQLYYVEVAEQAKDHDKYQPGRDCANCMFFQPANNNGCALFAGREVESKGWCMSWVEARK